MFRANIGMVKIRLNFDIFIKEKEEEEIHKNSLSNYIHNLLNIRRELRGTIETIA